MRYPRLLLLLSLLFLWTGISPVQAETREQKASRFVRLLQKKHYTQAASLFNPTMKRLFNASRLKTFWEGMQLKVGAFVKQQGRYSKQLKYAGKTFELVFVIVQFKKSTLELRVVFNDKKEIAGLRVHPHIKRLSRVRGKAVVRRFVKMLVARKYNEAAKTFDATMKRVFAVRKLKVFWERLQQQMGAFKAQGRIRQNTVKVPSGVYYPTLVAVTFAKGKLDFRIVLNGKNQVAGLRLQAHQDKKAAFPVPSYVNKKKFLELRVKVGKGKYPLDARLTLPHGQGKVPGVVLVHGSGAHDFDETIGPNKPFRDLAWGLSSRGVAVLRYVKRNKAWASVLMKRVNELTLKHEVLDDAIQAARQLLSHPRVHKVFIVGHSLGGYAAPLIAQKAPKTVSGIVILAGNARPLETLILEQYRYILGLDGKYTKQEKAILAALKKKVKRVQSGNLKKATAKQLPLGLPPKYWAFLRSYSQTETAFQIKQPILVMQGGRDYQVTKKDFQMWKSGLSSKSNVSFKLYPTLNHLFMFGKGRSTPQEYRKAGHVSLQVIKDVVNWVLKN